MARTRTGWFALATVSALVAGAVSLSSLRPGPRARNPSGLFGQGGGGSKDFGKSPWYFYVG
ncbi:hypothetical protein ACIPWI_08630 [Streptomyces sp. NPDC090046]|uniref:hypothetical protein n=1 Tax=Streptomyces sp. NPDC090046 TaxID=3365928 RepID=UPI0037F795DB